MMVKTTIIRIFFKIKYVKKTKIDPSLQKSVKGTQERISFGNYFCFFVLFPPAFQKLPSSSPRLMRILEHLTLLSPGDLIPYAEALTGSMGLLLESAVPRRILQTLNKLWMSLNTVMPRRYTLWTQLNTTKDHMEIQCGNCNIGYCVSKSIN